MPLISMPTPAIDRTRAGLLTVSSYVLADLLGLSRRLEVTGSSSDQIVLRIEGDQMPDIPADGNPLPVSLLCRVQVEEDGTRHVFAKWSHDDAHVEWKISP